MTFNNWKMPNDDEIRLEHKLEYVNKKLSSLCNGAFDDVHDFIKAVHNAQVVSLTPSHDNKISYRSHTKSFDQLISLLKTYRSWGEFRSEISLKGLYDSFGRNKPMAYPMVLKFSSGKMRVLSGNTRLDIAFQLGINPKVLMIQVP